MKNSTVYNFNYRLGQHLDDWHPGEKFYAHNKETGGAKEMVSYDLTWIVGLFGWPHRIVGLKGNSLNWEIDDTYSLSLDFGKTFGNILIDVVSRPPIRRLVLDTDKGLETINFERSEEMYYDEIKAFVAAVKGEKQFPNTLDDDIKILKMVERL